MTNLTPYNISLTSSSPTFLYEPFRDGSAADDHGDPANGWRGTFSELQVWPSPGIENVGLGVPLRETYMDGAYVTLNFEGTGIYLCLTPINSSYTFTIDNNPITTAGSGSDPACASSGGQVMVYAAGLEYANHSATLRVNAEGEADFLFYGGLVTLGISGTNAVVQYIDDTDPGWTYEPGGDWIYSDPAGEDAVGDYNQTRHYLCQWGASYNARYTFNGSSAVQLLGLLNWNVGPYTVQLNDITGVYNASDLWRESQQVLFFQGGLDPSKEYTILLMNYDANAPNASQPYSGTPCATVDALVLTKPAPASTPSGNPTPVGAIAGGVSGGVVALCIIAFLLWFFVWRRRQLNLKQPVSLDTNPTVFTPPTAQAMSYTSSNPGYWGTAMTPDGNLTSRSGGYTDGPSSTDHNTVVVQNSPSTPATPYTPFWQSKTRCDSPGDRRETRLGRALPRTASSEPTATPQPSSDVQLDSNDYDRAPTQALVSVLNRRLHAEYREENEESELPNYTPHL
ncbi:hypothetical protein CALCODRAFT_520968 [Calocera cornea HHB12733]|uniref:Uncharacterized protein n=1 Tax=Calocera cornea HHB12733 TaxID=1353952 RepID=A0A165D4I2_9BASI|nr:hypothetical protein CALCODRAFT_520968 [Calocera cornea HHB12733]